MKSLSVCFAALGLAFALLTASAAGATSLLIEAEELESLGGWQHSRDTRVVREFLWADIKGHVAPAAGAITLPHAGRWRL